MEKQMKELKKREDGFVEVSLQDAKDFDEYVLAQMCKDGSCLSVIKDHRDCTRFFYDTNGYLDLKSYVTSHRFEKMELMEFLIYLFENLIRVNTNKPVYLQSDLIYLSYDGGVLKFLVLPLTMDKWIFQCEQSQVFLKELISALKGEDSYQTIGFLVEQLKQKEMSFPNLLQGLHDLYAACRPKPPWYQKWVPSKSKENERFQVRDIPRPPRVVPSARSPDMFMETMVLFSNHDEAVFIDQKTKAVYTIEKEHYLIGRGTENDLCIQDTFISHKHAVYEKQTKQLIDQGSSNGTFVNHNRITSITLHHGDIVSFANHEFLYEEGELGKEDGAYEGV
ncbi:FHA domain-containing protein [[Eubacterium] hominis]|uniref:FHA domain-containing protein n=1 Tax=[Eubacterium] hominis TaxID=2764325 RepID=UPI003A4D4137